MSELLRMVLGGIALGIPLALACGRLAASLLYGLQPQDAGTVAARLNAIAALRYE